MWTKKAPDVEGWYWVRYSETGNCSVIRVARSNGCLCWHLDDFFEPVDRHFKTGYEFQGPIHPNEDAAPVPDSAPVGLTFPWDNGDGVLGSGLVMGKQYRIGHSDGTYLVSICPIGECGKGIDFPGFERPIMPLRMVRRDAVFTLTLEPTNEL